MEIKKIYKDLSIKYNLTPYQIELICETPFRFLKETMLKGEYKSLMLPYWGKYTVKPYRKLKINEDKVKRNNRRLMVLSDKISEDRKDISKEETDLSDLSI